MIPVDPITLLAFVPAALALNLTPGADMMFCLCQGLRGGPRAALAADAGIALGAMIHVLIAGLGLGALVATSPWLFDTIRWIGVAYLLWLAAAVIRQGPVSPDVPDVRSSRAFAEALIVNLTNPKVILFVLAFVPQFVDPSRGSILFQFMALGAILSTGGLIVNGAVGVFAGSVGRGIALSPLFGTVLGWISASVFAAMALRLAIGERS